MDSSWIKNYLITQAVNEGKLAAEDVLGYYLGKKKQEKALKTAQGLLYTPGGVTSYFVNRNKALNYKAMASQAAVGAQFTGLQLQGERAAQTALENEQKRIANMYGYSSTIKTSGTGVLGQAPIKRATLLGA